VKTTLFCIACLCPSLWLWTASAQENQSAAHSSDKARVFITDSQSWEMAGGGGGSAAGFGGATRGGARPQTAEIIKTFGERCPEVMVNNIQEKTDYIVLLDHEGGKGLLQHRNKVAVFARVSGDSIVSRSTRSLGNSVQDACEAISKDWAAHGAAMRDAAAVAQSKSVSPQVTGASPPPAAAAPADDKGKILVSSVPDGADVYVDDGFVGNAPATLKLPAGKHTVRVSQQGYKDWAKEVSVFAGSEVGLKASLEKN
jgi:hypothetical protein